MQKTKKSGLPGAVEMRHDGHFVELITSRAAGPRIRMIPIERIDPNPLQARSELGNLEELKSSIKDKGVLEPILVRPRGGRYEIIAGERRYMASKSIGMKDMPCIEMNVEDNEAMEISLIENLQRKDLNVFEEADGLKTLAEIYSYNHAQIAEKLGKARSTVTEIINLSKIPHNIRELCQQLHITSRTTLLEISKIKSEEDMIRLINAISERELRREDTRDLSKKIKGKSAERIKRYVYNYQPEGDEYCRLRIEFRKQSVNRTEIIRILEDLIEKLKKNSAIEK
ncbi:MAG: ParB/RepB/Spo0J family partition protein [Candidatus Aminicenantaceae bacterium]